MTDFAWTPQEAFRASYDQPRTWLYRTEAAVFADP